VAIQNWFLVDIFIPVKNWGKFWGKNSFWKSGKPSLSDLKPKKLYKNRRFPVIS
jgi:hypothetical protein